MRCFGVLFVLASNMSHPPIRTQRPSRYAQRLMLQSRPAAHFLPELRSDFNDYVCRLVVHHRIQRQLDMRISKAGSLVWQLTDRHHHLNVCHEPFDGCATLLIPALVSSPEPPSLRVTLGSISPVSEAHASL